MGGKQGSLQESTWSDRLSSIPARGKPNDTKSCGQPGGGCSNRWQGSALEMGWGAELQSVGGASQDPHPHTGQELRPKIKSEALSVRIQLG